ncbi:hypothetical protein GQ457_02G036680 [Hibiscus cannabinus]
MATETTFVQPSIPKFDGHYDHWAMLMENFLRSKEYWNLVENGISVAPVGTTLTEAQQRLIDDQKLKDLKAKNYLFQALDRSILETILKKDTSKDIWDSVKKKYQGSTRAQLQALRREFETLQMKAGETVNDYFARTLTIANKMKADGEHKSETEIVEKVLRSMTSKFNYKVCSIEEAQDTTDLSIDELQSSLLVHEQKMLNPEEEQALKWECHSQESNYTESSDEMLLMARVGDESLKSDEWFLDSGCSNHMCYKKDYFADLNEEFVDSVKLRNNASLTVKGKGNVRLQIDNNIQIITEVFYVPELKNNLLSLGQLQEKGLAVLIQHNHCKVYHSEKGVIIQSVMSSNRMFKIAAVSLPSAPTCFNIATEDIGHLWHCRYGHLSFNGLNTLKQKEMRQLTAPYSPQQNGVAERKNRTIMNMVRSMMIARGVPKCFWAEAVNWAVHVLNRSPTLTVQNMTPEEAWSGKRPSVVKNPKHIDFMIPLAKRIIISRDVVFEEDCGWNWGEAFNNSIQSKLDWNHDTESNVEVDDHEEIHEEADEEGLVQQDGAVQQEETSEHLLSRRQHTQPSWMQDYVNG